MYIQIYINHKYLIDYKNGNYKVKFVMCGYNFKKQIDRQLNAPQQYIKIYNIQTKKGK